MKPPSRSLTMLGGTLITCLFQLLTACAESAGTQILATSQDARVLSEPNNKTHADAIGYLANVMDQFHRDWWVYSDGDAAGNHFVEFARMINNENKNEPEKHAAAILPSMNTFCTNNPHSGIDCIEVSFRPSKTKDWGGWYFMQGVLTGTNTAPVANWGTSPNAGVDLQQATQLSFWVRGRNGGEIVKFFAFGVGWPTNRYRDSSPTQSHQLTLTRQWTNVVIHLDKSQPLSYVLGGFGWAASAKENQKDISFYLDDISYDIQRSKEPHLLVSFETESDEISDLVLRNAAFTYDNALALIAFLAVGDKERAGMIADAFVEAQEHDFIDPDGSLRSAYQGGDLLTGPGWTPLGKTNVARISGFTVPMSGNWGVPVYNVSRNTGNMAWATLGLVAYHEAIGSPKTSRYLESAKAVGNWIVANCTDARGFGGYTGGTQGTNASQLLTNVCYKATEHNIDLYAAFHRLYLLTADKMWEQRAQVARTFWLNMWDQKEGKFWTGTHEDGITINTNAIPLDVQAWSLLALGKEGRPYLRALDYAEKYIRIPQSDGFDFSKKPASRSEPEFRRGCERGVWYEGTAQMAAAYQWVDGVFDGSGSEWRKRADEILEFLGRHQSNDGAMKACDAELWTGFALSDGHDWTYASRKHVGATAWLVLAKRGYNPFGRYRQ